MSEGVSVSLNLDANVCVREGVSVSLNLDANVCVCVTRTHHHIFVCSRHMARTQWLLRRAGIFQVPKFLRSKRRESNPGLDRAH